MNLFIYSNDAANSCANFQSAFKSTIVHRVLIGEQASKQNDTLPAKQKHKQETRFS